jgi:hypothetical protein
MKNVEGLPSTHSGLESRHTAYLAIQTTLLPGHPGFVCFHAHIKINIQTFRRIALPTDRDRVPEI